MIPLARPYQDILITGAANAYRNGVRRLLLVLVTGGGKTFIFSDIVRRTVARGNRVVIVAHRIEICEQISQSLTLFGIRHGWIGPGRPTTDEMVQVAMVQSLAKRLDKVREPALLVVDEAHHATAGSYVKITGTWPKARVLGVTASPARTDGRGLGDCFEAMVEGPSMGELIARGYLSPFRYLAPPPVASLSGIKVRGGDYAIEDLAAIMDRSAVTGDAVAHYAKHLNGRPAIAFCVSVEHAEHCAEEFVAAGWKAASVDGAMDPAERRRRIQAIGNGGLNVLTSCDVVSEGTDIPAVAGALLLRPTKSVIVFLQQVGRVLRVKPDGGPAIILDHSGNVYEHGMPDAKRQWSLTGGTKRTKASPVRQCPKCYAAFAPAPKCPACGHVFPIKARGAVQSDARDGALAEINERDAASREHLLRAAPLKDLLKAAKTREQLEEIRKARGYHHGWVNRMLVFKQAAGRNKAQAWRARAA